MKRKSLTRQCQETLEGYLCIGKSKRNDRLSGADQRDRIYSWSTFRNYLKWSCKFTAYCKKQHGCRYLDECKPYVAEYMATRTHLSPYTQKLELSALRKLYQDDFDHIKIADRLRVNITRSRYAAARDSGFSEEKNAALVAFCKSTGLRRAELRMLRVEDVDLRHSHVTVRNGKGGRPRTAEIHADSDELTLIERLLLEAKDGFVCPRVPQKMDVHGYRRIYATRVYNHYKRPLETLSRVQKYYCRTDRKGVVYDRRAMLLTSQNLGHNRINVIASHYLF